MSKKTDNTATLTNERLYALLPALSNLIAKDTPISISIKLRKTLQSIRLVVEALDEVRTAKLKVHTKQDDKGKETVNSDAFTADMEIMLKETSDVDIHSVNAADFPDDFEISATDLDILMETNVLTE